MPKSLSEITDEARKQIKDLAAALYSPKEIAVILGIDISSFVDACYTEGNDCYNDFNGALLQIEYDLRFSILKLAKAGSSPAQVMALDMLNKSKLKRMEK